MHPATPIAIAPSRIVAEYPTRATSGPPSRVATNSEAKASASERPMCFSYSSVRPICRNVS